MVYMRVYAGGGQAVRRKAGRGMRRHCALLCLAAGLAALLSRAGTGLAEGGELSPAPLGEAEGYVYYHSTSYPYYRLSPHRCACQDASGDTQDGRIPAAFVLLDLREYGGKSWTPDRTSGWTADAPGNYLVAYGCDLSTRTRAGTRYRRRNLEDAVFLSESAAQRMRAVLQCAYPFVSAEEMLARLVAAGVLEERNGIVSAPENFKKENAERTVSESELLSAVQTAVWACAAGEDTAGPKLSGAYTETAAPGLAGRTVNPDGYDGRTREIQRVKNNISAVYDYLTGLGTADAPAPDRLVTDLTLTALRTDDGTGEATATVRLRLNGTPDAEDALVLRVGETRYAIANPNLGLPVIEPDADGCYTLLLAGLTEEGSVTLEVSGTQTVAAGAYLYEPYGGQDAAQCMVGVYGGTAQVLLRRQISLTAMTQRARLRSVAELTEKAVVMPLSGGSLTLFQEGRDGRRVRIAEGLSGDAEGLVEVRRLLPPGEGERYVFQETAPPAGFSLPEKPEKAVDAATTVRLVHTPAAEASVCLTLLDGSTGEQPLPGIGFALYRRLFGTEALFLGDRTTDAQGRITVDGLCPGDYWFSQSTTPEGYATAAEEHAFSVGSSGGAIQLTVYNTSHRTVSGEVCFADPAAAGHPAAVTVRLYCGGALLREQRVSAETGWRYCFEELPIFDDSGAQNVYAVEQAALPGYAAEYVESGIRNTQRRADIVLENRNRRGEPLRGAVFVLRSAADGTHVCTAATDAAGRLCLYGLRAGSYLLTQRRAPAGYRALSEALILTLTDPNTAADGTEPMQALLTDASGMPLSDGCIVSGRRILPESPLGIALCASACAALPCLAAVGLRARKGGRRAFRLRLPLRLRLPRLRRKRRGHAAGKAE